MNFDLIALVYAWVSLLDCFFTFCAKLDGYFVAADFDGFFLQVWFVVAWGFAVTMAYCVTTHFAFFA